MTTPGPVGAEFHGELFGRVARLAVGDRSQAIDQGTEFEGFKLTFEIDKTTTSKPNPARISIVNVGDSTAKAVFKRGNRLRLSAGYTGSEAVIFFGEIQTVEHYHAGPDLITEIEAVDGAAAFKAYVSAQFARGASWATIVRTIANGMGLQVSADTLVKFTGGPRYAMSVHGQAFRDLDLIARSIGVSWCVESGQLIALQPGQAHNRIAVDIGPDSGLVGSPSRLEQTAKLKRQRVSFKSLLQARLHAGALVNLRSERVAGLYRVDRVTHVGDTHGDDWTSACECTETT